MMRLAVSTLFITALTLNACGSDKAGTSSDAGSHPDGSADAATDASGAVKVTVSGFAAPHPLTAAFAGTPDGGAADGGASSSDFSMVNVAVVDPTTVINDPTAPPLAGGPLDTAAAGCNATNGCPWSFDNVDISGITLGLVGILDDARATNKVWVKTGTGIGSAAFITSVKASPAPITMRQLFVVSKATESGLAMLAAAALSDTTLTGAVLEARGFMLGSVVGKVSLGAPSVMGATVTASGTTASKVDILYPNDTFTGFGSSTASHGTFLVVPKAVTPQTSIVGTWTVAGPTSSTMTWTAATAGTNPGTAFVLLFAANETP
jgi:hypothetical protein